MNRMTAAPTHRRLDLTAMVHLLWGVRGVPWSLVARLVRKHVCYPDTRYENTKWFRVALADNLVYTRYGRVAYWDTSALDDMSDFFAEEPDFNEPLTYWDTSNVENMEYMFFYAASFNQPLEKWDVSNVCYMDHMFFEAVSFNQPLEKWDVANVTDMRFMFCRTTAFNQPLGSWCVVETCIKKNMFEGAISFNQPVLYDVNLT